MDYSFIDLNKKLSYVENLSSVQLLVDGINLDTTFRDNYRTLFVNGRNNMSRSINTLSFSSSNVGGGKRTKSKIFGLTNRFIYSTLEP